MVLCRPSRRGRGLKHVSALPCEHERFQYIRISHNLLLYIVPVQILLHLFLANHQLMRISPLSIGRSKRKKGILGNTINIEPAMLHNSTSDISKHTTIVVTGNAMPTSLSSTTKSTITLPYTDSLLTLSLPR